MGHLNHGHLNLTADYRHENMAQAMGCCICCTEVISSLSSATQSHRAFASMLEPGQCSREKERGSEICQNLRKVVASYPVIQNLCIFETHLEFLHANLLRRSEGAPCVFIDQRTVVCAIVVVYVVSIGIPGSSHRPSGSSLAALHTAIISKLLVEM